MKKTILLAAGLLFSSSVAFAHGDEGHKMDIGHNPCSMQHMDGHMGHNPCDMGSMQGMENMKGMFIKKKVIDGYEVSFHVMKAPKGMAHGGTHHLMMKVEKSANIIALQAVNSKVTHPNAKSESKMMMKMGDWYMASYDLGHAGEHKIMVLFKTEDGKKHFGGIVYADKP